MGRINTKSGVRGLLHPGRETDCAPGTSVQPACALASPQSCLANPFEPIPLQTPAGSTAGSGARSEQRLRRSRIYATIRSLLADGGREKVTVRNIASASGYAVQTIYNLVGNRDNAVSQALAEYKMFVCLSSAPAPEDPSFLPQVLKNWFRAVSVNTELQRQANLLYFTKKRNIFYDIRSHQTRLMRFFLIKQKNSGILRDEVLVDDLSEVLIKYVFMNWLDWADSGYSLDLLKRNIHAGYAVVLREKFSPEHRDMVIDLLAALDD